MSGRREKGREDPRGGGASLYRVCICDDEPQACERLRAYIERYNAQGLVRLEPRVFPSALALLAHYPSPADIVILDIQMPHMDGMEAAERIRRMDPEACILFITNLREHALAGYRVGALNFLIKPVGYPRFKGVMDEALGRIKKRENSFIALKAFEGYVRLDIRELVYIEAFKGRVRLHMADRSLDSYASMGRMEEALGDRGFFRPHVGYMVNMNWVRAVENALVRMGNGDSLPVSRHRKKEFLEALTAFWGGLL